ncbi:hypothetical protein C8Q76DRAFT_393003 [Earliella scabrosa]|nr:hypothetical protein C8Q76DRAFT_393003 [Earliella scabrosa]
MCYRLLCMSAPRLFVLDATFFVVHHHHLIIFCSLGRPPAMLGDAALGSRAWAGLDVSAWFLGRMTFSLSPSLCPSPPASTSSPTLMHVASSARLASQSFLSSPSKSNHCIITHTPHPSIHPPTHAPRPVHTLHIYISLRSRPRPYPYRTRKSVKSRLVYLLLLPPIRIVTPQPKFHRLYARSLWFSLYIIPPSDLASCYLAVYPRIPQNEHGAPWRSGGRFYPLSLTHSLPLRLSLSLYSIDYRSRLQDTSSGAR